MTLIMALRAAMRTTRCSRKTVEAYAYWVQALIHFCGRRHPRQIGELRVDRGQVKLAYARAERRREAVRQPGERARLRQHAGARKRATRPPLRRSVAAQLLDANTDSRTIRSPRVRQEPRTTMLYPDVVDRGPLGGVVSPRGRRVGERGMAPRAPARRPGRRPTFVPPTFAWLTH